MNTTKKHASRSAGQPGNEPVAFAVTSRYASAIPEDDDIEISNAEDEDIYADIGMGDYHALDEY